MAPLFGPSRSSRSVSAFFLICSTGGLLACESDRAKDQRFQDDGSFVSHVPGAAARGESGGDLLAGDGDSGDEGAPNGDGDGDGADRAISEADIIQTVGDRLYALSRYSGLTIINARDPSHLRVMGNYRTSATPFEMYVEDGTAYVMFNSWYSYEYNEDTQWWDWISTSRMVALDVRDPASISVLGDVEVAGEISDSRKVGDIIYLVTHQSSYCWRCDAVASTRVTSFDASDSSSFRLIDQVTFNTEDESWGQRSISVTQERVYVSGWSYGSDDGGDVDGTIDVVDISDPAGSLEAGAQLDTAGPVQSRWQMDEYDGVLRVITQPGLWGGTSEPVLETFAVTSASQITKLATLPLVLPRPEDLQSVRFDGLRAYAVTFERTDPLFTFDLTDPAHPKQMGELEIPGFLYHMEPRGDRMFALGYDQSVDGGSLHVSLFDVSDLSNPTMIERVNFGGDWAQFAEGQDQIHKAFNILQSEGLILVPFSGWDYDDGGCGGDYLSGIQLVDMTMDSLTLRGVAPQVGSARRAFLHREALFGVTDNAVQTFDISDRTAPVEMAQLDVARNITTVRAMGDTMLRFGTDWWTNQAILDFVALDDVTSAEPLGEIDLSEYVSGSSGREVCEQGNDGSYFYSYEHWTGQVFVHGNFAYIPRQSEHYWYTGGKDESRAEITFFIVDLTDKTALALVGQFKVEDALRDSYFSGIIETENSLLVGRVTYGKVLGSSFSYDVIDLSEPGAPRLASTLTVPQQYFSGGWGYGMEGCSIDVGWGWWGGYYGDRNALVSGDVVASQHQVPLKDGTGRVRYYLDRLDVTDPDHPVLLAEVNIPGQVVHYDHDEKRVLTVDYLQAQIPATNDACYRSGHYAEYRAGHCTVYQRRVNLLELDGATARLVDRELIDVDGPAGTIAISDDRIFFADQPGYYSGGSPKDVKFHTIAVGDSLKRLGDVTLPEGAGWWYPQVFARDGRAFIVTEGDLTVVDATGSGTPTATHHQMPGWYCSSLEVRGDFAYCAMGQSGVSAFPLD